jgi:hypothetical protein
VCKVFQGDGLSLDLPALQDRFDDLKLRKEGAGGSAPCQVKQCPQV